MIFIIIILAILLILAGIYNGLVRSRNRVNEAWSDIDVQLKRRYDLIPNLIETVKGYATHEKTVFEEVTAARTQAQSAGSLQAKQAAEDRLSGAIRGIFAVAENYPQLQANQSFLDLQNQLTDTEDKIAYSRQYYNTQVMEYNRQIRMVPGLWIAPLFGFTSRAFFKVEESERQAPKVKFE